MSLFTAVEISDGEALCFKYESEEAWKLYGHLALGLCELTKRLEPGHNQIIRVDINLHLRIVTLNEPLFFFVFARLLPAVPERDNSLLTISANIAISSDSNHRNAQNIGHAEVVLRNKTVQDGGRR